MEQPKTDHPTPHEVRMNRLSDLLSSKLPFFYGYVVLFVAFVAQICSSPGQTYAISAFTPFLLESLALTKSQLSAAYMLGTLLAAIPLFAIGPIADRHGLRVTTAIVAVLMAIACQIASQATGFYSILVAFMLLRFLGQGSLTLLSSNMVSMWFQERLGTVNACLWAGGALSFAAVPPILLNLIDNFGWRAAYAGLGLCILLLLTPVAILLLRNRAEDVDQLLDGHTRDSQPAKDKPTTEPEITLGAAASHHTFWILASGLCIWAMIGTGIVFHALPIFAQFGISTSNAQLLFTTFSAFMLAAQIIGGVLSDRLPMNRLLALGFLLLTLGTCCIPFTKSMVQVHAFAALFGSGQGLAISVNSTMWARYYGRRHLGKIRGTVWCLTVAGSGCGPLILGLFADYTGTFTPGLWCFVVLLIPMGPLALATTPPDNPIQTHPAPTSLPTQ